MQLSFSTLGCPNWTLQEILAAAVDLRYDAIELRGLGEDLYLPDARLFRGDGCRKVKEMLDARGLYIACVSTDCMLHRGDTAEAEVRAYLELAAALGAKNLRVLGDSAPAPTGETDFALVDARLRMLAPFAEQAGVTLLLESNGAFADSKRLRDTLERTGSSAVGALWDVSHPVRYCNETPEETFQNLNGYIRHVHMKDTAAGADGTLQYRMLGEGTLPLQTICTLLKSSGYSGCLSLEWTKRWNRELEDAGIVFAQFVHTVRKMWEQA